MICTAANNFRKLFCGPCANTCCHAPPRMDCRTQLAYGTRATSIVYMRMLCLGCCRCAAASVLLLCCCCRCCCCCCCCCSDCFVPITLLHEYLVHFFSTTTAAVTVQLFGFCSSGCWEVELRDLTLCQVCVRPRMRAYE